MNCCDQSERLRAIIDELTESRERWYGMAKQFAVELTKAKSERDDAREHADCEKQFADGLKKRIAELEMVLDDERAHCEEFMAEAERMKEERDEAREIASEGHREMQHYFPDLKWIQLPWEGDEKCSSQS